MEAKIAKSYVEGKVTAPSSKSYTQRATACALIAEGVTEIANPSMSEDAMSALLAARMLGAQFQLKKSGAWSIMGGTITTPEDAICCGGSATALRLFTSISAHAPGTTVLTGDASLRRRPINALLEAMNSLGAKCFSTRGNGLAPIVVLGGGIAGGEATMRGDISSQFISSLLISCTKAKRDAKIALSSALESRHYVEMTLEVLGKFGGSCDADFGRGIFVIQGGQILRPCSYAVEGDYSSAAFMLAAGLLGGKVEVAGITIPSRQGDSQFVEIIHRMGGAISQTGNGLKAETSLIEGIELDARQIPDLVPIVVALASKAVGDTTITGIGRLRLKESDRVTTVAEAIGRMGGSVETSKEKMVISGGRMTRGALIDPHGDHRIAMACAVLAIASEGETTIKDAECVSKSYPSFFKDLKAIGANVEMGAVG